MKHIIHFLLFSFVAIGGVSAQSDIQLTHFMFNKLTFNPAYAGAKGAFDASAIYRKQWSGIDGAPTTANLNIHTPFAGKRNGLGVSLAVDEIGKTQTTALDFAYAYRLNFGENAKLSIGLSGRMEQVKLRWSLADPLDNGDESIPQGDETAFAPNFGAGAYFLGKNYYAGLSIPRFLKNALYLDRSNERNNRSDVSTWYFMGGFMADLSQSVEIQPSMLVSYNPAAPVDVDLNVNIKFMDAFWIGGSYRLGDSFDALIGYEFENGIRFGISADFTTSELSKYTSGSYEAMLGYTFKCRNCEVSHLRFF